MGCSWFVARGDLTDEQWAVLEPLLSAAPFRARPIRSATARSAGPAVAGHRSSPQRTARPGTRSSAASIASRDIEPWPPGTTNSRSATRLPSSLLPSTSGCGVLVRRQLVHPYSSTVGGIDGLTDRMHPQFGHDPFGGVVAHLSDADDPLQPSLFEPEPYGGRSGLGGQALPPVGTSQPPADLNSRQYLCLPRASDAGSNGESQARPSKHSGSQMGPPPDCRWPWRTAIWKAIPSQVSDCPKELAEECG